MWILIGVVLVVNVLLVLNGLLLLSRARPFAAGRVEGARGAARAGVQGGGISVIIPARNEAHNLPGLLATLQRQDAPALEVMVVDDQSTDETAAVARSFGAAVIEVHEKGAGWLGKSWACWLGAKAARGRTLLFLDADTRLAEDALARLMQAREESAPGMMMVQPYHRTVRAHEQLAALFNVIVVAATGRFSAWSGGRPGQSGFGPLVMIDRDTYFRVGGHEAVRTEVLEDIALADVARAQGVPVRLDLGKTLCSFRMYPNGLGDLVEGFSKGMAAGASATPVAVLLVFSLWLSGGFITLGAAALAMWQPAWLLAALVGWVANSLVLRHNLARVGHFRAWTWVFFPVPLLAFVVLFARSAWLKRVRSEVRWKGRAIRLAKEGSPGSSLVVEEVS